MPRPRNSADQSVWLRTRWSEVRILPRAPRSSGETGKRSRLRPCGPSRLVGSTPTGSTTLGGVAQAGQSCGFLPRESWVRIPVPPLKAVLLLVIEATVGLSRQVVTLVSQPGPVGSIPIDHPNRIASSDVAQWKSTALIRRARRFESCRRYAHACPGSSMARALPCRGRRCGFDSRPGRNSMSHPDVAQRGERHASNVEAEGSSRSVRSKPFVASLLSTRVRASPNSRKRGCSSVRQSTTFAT